MWMRLLLTAIVFWIATGFTNPTNGQQLVISGNADQINPELGGYVEEIVPGDKREYAVHITNPTDEEITALLYVADAMPALGGGKGFTLPGDPDTGSAAWYRTPDRSVTLKAGETQSFTLDMQIPASVEPGQHVSVIGVYDQSMRESVERKMGLEVVLNYKLDEAKPPEAIPHAALYTLENGKACLTVLLINEGGSLSEPEIAVRVKRQDDTNELLFERKSTVNSIYAGTVAQIRVELSRPLSPGSYLAEIKTTLGSRMDQKEFSFEVTSEDGRTAPSGTVIQVAEDGSPPHESSFGLRPSYIYGGMMLILVIIVAVLRRRASRKT
ncbi:hypothetical protein BSK66_24850 [Paenibacillus odorifer]|uniref:COG1470 family protein n=1 Tax=Paenibacillus TaxID=44249 RepID=UPI0003E28B33|nr:MULTISPECIES: hypothetical protein [Paenibacillus]ETT54824.1 hypothetical protein C171_20189 [Paenibacillus sp. FSL H8-237]OME50697.1 hypothetical protein BSK66_24850 [Paenibacillus odorifer]SIR49878.1 hypothetical protein SAMN05880555_3994 [Paenibacillus sp. RU4X]SIR58863.1 hypothetical protein SAMN05880570_3997 [Paenibacillus sp. RU4T]